jgi:hypothetical protein
VDSRGDDTLLYVEEGSVSVHSKQTGQDTLVKEGESVLIGANGIVATAEEQTGDPLVDRGFASNGGGNDNGGNAGQGNEHRRGEANDHHGTAKSGGSSGGTSGGSSGSSGGTSGGTNGGGSYGG